MKKDDIYKLIEKGFETKKEYKKFLTSFVNELQFQGYVDMAKTIQNIINKNTFAIFSAMNETKKRGLLNIIDKSSQDTLSVIIAGINEDLIHSLLLFGRPGTGKTKIVFELGEKLNRDVVTLSLGEILDSKFGKSIQNFEIFMKKNISKNNIIFIDEAESIFTSRGKTNDVFEVDRLLTTMLQIMDMKRNAIIIFATNMINKIDKAIIRRFDYHVDFDKFIINQELAIEEILLDNPNWSLNDNEKSIIKDLLGEIHKNDHQLRIFDVKIIIKWFLLNKIVKIKQKDNIENVKSNFFNIKVNRG